MSTEVITAAAVISSADPIITNLGPIQTPNVAEAGNGFASILNNMIGNVENKVGEANNLVRQFAVDDNVPVHKVTFALEEARLSVEMMMQFRTRLVEGYREIMNMQM